MKRKEKRSKIFLLRDRDENNDGFPMSGIDAYDLSEPHTTHPRNIVDIRELSELNAK